MDKKELLKIAEKINDNWQKQMPDVGPCHWERSAYMIGNMAAYEITKKEEYLDDLNVGGFFVANKEEYLSR